MAQSVKIEKLLEGLDQELNIWVELDQKKLASCGSLLARTMVEAVKAFQNAKPGTEDQKKLKDKKAELEKLNKKHDAEVGKLSMKKVAELNKLVEKYATEPAEYTAHSAELDTEYAPKVAKLQEDRQTEVGPVESDIFALENVRYIAGIEAAKKTLGFSKAGEKKATSHKLGEAEFLIVDLLKTRPYHATFYVQKDRTLHVFPVSADYDKKVQGSWQEAGKLADTDQLKSQTNIQRFAYEWINRFDRTKTLAQNTERVNKVFVDGSPKSIGVNGQCGGVSNVHRLVETVVEGQGKQVPYTELYDKERYGFPQPEKAEDQTGEDQKKND